MKIEDQAEKRDLVHHPVHVQDPAPGVVLGLIPGSDLDLVVSAQRLVLDLVLGSVLNPGQFHEEDQGLRAPKQEIVQEVDLIVGVGQARN